MTTVVSTQTGIVTDIIEKLEEILSTTLGYELEDLSNVDINAWGSAVLAQLLYLGTVYDDTMNERPDTRQAKFLIKLMFRDEQPDTSRVKQYTYDSDVYEAINAAAINSTDKLVRAVIHDETNTIYEPPISTLELPLRVRYRNET